VNEALTLSPLLAWVGALSLILNFGLSLYGLLSSGARANKLRLDRHETMLGEQDKRLGRVEQTMRGMPAKDDLHGLQLSMERMAGDLREMRAIMGRMESVVGRHEDHLLDGGKR
jgi:hypothetical protein